MATSDRGFRIRREKDREGISHEALRCQTLKRNENYEKTFEWVLLVFLSRRWKRNMLKWENFLQPFLKFNKVLVV